MQLRKLPLHMLAAIFMALMTSLWSVPLHAESTEAEQQAEKIRSNRSRYYFGEGNGLTIEEADQSALQVLAQSIRAVVASDVKVTTVNDDSHVEMASRISSFASLNNTEQIILSYSDETGYRVMRYIARADLQEAIDQQRKKITDWVENAHKLESKADIAGALRYYYWAYALASVHPDNISMELDGAQRMLKSWLDIKLRAIMANINVSLDGITEQPGNANPYLVNLRLTYGGSNVGSLDFSYLTGLKKVDGIHAKNGEATLEFPSLPSGNITLKVDYAGVEQGKLFDDELASYFAVNRPMVIKESTLSVPVKGAAPAEFRIEEPEVTTSRIEETRQLLEEAPMSIAPRRERIEVSTMFNPDTYVELMNRVADAIASGDYASVKPLFTEEGYDLFDHMMRSGDIKLASTEREYTIETVGKTGLAIGKRIPVIIKYKGRGRKMHTCREGIVLRFDGSRRISSVAYALTERAEDDIFRKSRWGMEARYAMQTFMEDYQTAFALKRLDYIEKIFAKGAIIISGSVDRTSGKKAARLSDSGGMITATEQPNIRYKRRNKEEYLNFLRTDFNNKKFIQLSFEDTDISKASGVYNDVYWIGLKQNYSSDIYSDVGFLTLMIDMDIEQPQIVVRTWTPEKLDLDEMKSRYTQQ